MGGKIIEVWKEVIASSQTSPETKQAADEIVSSKIDLHSKTTELLLGDNIELRVLAVQVLGKLNEMWASDLLITTFQDQRKDVELRSLCGYQLGFMNEKRSLPIFITTMKSDALVETRCVATYCLGLFRPTKLLLRELINVLKDNKEEAVVRARAAESLGALGDKVVVPLLVESLNEPYIDIRFFAARALGWLRDTRALPALERLSLIDNGICDIKPDGGPISQEALKAVALIVSSNE